jgi:outer membrane receptor protein involved in Fe transport
LAADAPVVRLVNSVLLGNQKLKPERMTEIEVGGDIGLFNDMVSVEATYYQKKVTDLLLQRTLAPSTGFSGILDNVGELENKGFELMVKGVVWNSDDFQWLSTVTVSQNKNKVTKLNGPAFAVANSFGIARVAEGEPLGFFYGPKYQRNADGSIKYDSLGRPLRDPVGQKIGDPNPSLVVAFVNDFEIFKNLTVHVQLDGMFGQDVFNFTRRILETPAFGNGKEYEKELSGQVAVGYFNNRRTIFEEYVEDASFVKLRELSVSYRLDQDFIKNLGLRSLEVTLSGRNLLSFDNYSGYDPEVNAASQSTLVRGFDWSTTPLPRTWILSLTLNL